MDRRLAMALENVTEAISEEMDRDLARTPQLRVVKPAEAAAKTFDTLVSWEQSLIAGQEDIVPKTKAAVTEEKRALAKAKKDTRAAKKAAKERYETEIARLDRELANEEEQRNANIAAGERIITWAELAPKHLMAAE